MRAPLAPSARAGYLTGEPMHTDARTLESGTVLEGDLCIVGAGAAGITLALEWVHSPLRVILLEGGGFDLEPWVQDLYRGDVIGRPYYPLHAARLHYFGGTTGHWTGFCAPLDEIDFERRGWVAHSGWPVGHEELNPFYARAHGILELGPYRYDVAYWGQGAAERAPLPLDAGTVWTKMWQFSPPTRFGTRYRDAICDARGVHLLTHANVCDIEADEALGTVTGVRVRTHEGKHYRVRARAYVLACCAIQNSRLLLASNRQARTGLGNANDLVGRFFMEHLEMPVAELVVAPTYAARMQMYAFSYGTTRARGELALTAAAQGKRRTLNGTVSLQAGTLGDEAQSTFQRHTPEEMEAYRTRSSSAASKQEVDSNTAGIDSSPESEATGEDGGAVFQLTVRQEQAPNPASRVSLSVERDALGMPRTRLDWQLTELDKRSVRSLTEVLADEMGRSGVGRMRLREWLLTDDRSWPDNLSGGWHHMGTTRMHPDPRQGVVDTDCRVHGLSNLYVAGSAVFPTAGAANPTLTIVALTLRLSDHLKGALR
jgi:Choline dehydrogenase and related flavoproteins